MADVRIRALLGTLAAIALSACASLTAPATQAPPTAGWTRLLQVDDRFAVYMERPVAPARDGRATFHLVYVYKPGVVFWEEREVAWQEYVAMTVDCRKDEVQAGLRRRFGPDGALVFSDEDRVYAPINAGTAVEAAANAACRKAWPEDREDIAASADWMDEARGLLSRPVLPPET